MDDNDVEDDSGGSLPLFFWGLLTALTLWWLYLRPMTTERRAGVPRGARPRLTPSPSPAPGNDADADPPESGAAVQPAETEPDDLTVIYGIGPARAARLREAGIFTYAGLAELDEDQLRAVKVAVGLGGADSSEWPKQARLAARGDWDGLEAFKDQLRAERG